MSKKIKFRHATRRILAAVFAVVLVVMMMLSVSVSAATNTAVTAGKDSLLHFRMVYKYGNNQEGFVSAGSCFLINSTTILTSAHIIDTDDAAVARMNDYEGGTYKPNNIAYKVMVQKDVAVYATLKKCSYEDDYAILTLNDSINKPYLKFADTETVEVTDQVFALGFPAEVSNIQDTTTYTASDVTITEGLVQKKTEYLGTPVIQHGATLTDGNSGGPLVNSEGYVIGVNKGTARDASGDKDYFYAVDSNQIVSVLEALFIEYTLAGETPAVDVTDAPAVTDAPVEEEPIIPTPTEAPVVPDGKGIDATKLIIIAAIIVLVLILVAVVVIIIVASSKKSKAPAAPARPTAGPMPTGAPAPQAPQAPQAPPYAQAYSRPSMPPQGAMPPMPANDGAGETSVLNEGAGETTVLGGGQATNFAIVKVKGGERVAINKPEFTIGKERRRVDYCIENNNSISRTHAKLRIRAGKCYITDLGSTNCTYVNGAKISPNQEVLLSNGDKIKFSDEEFEFVG